MAPAELLVKIQSSTITVSPASKYNAPFPFAFLKVILTSVTFEFVESLKIESVPSP